MPLSNQPAHRKQNPVLQWMSIINGIGNVHQGTSSGAPASGAWPNANRAIYVPVLVDAPAIVYRLWYYAGATASGNFDLGLYDINFKLLVSTGSIAQAGTNGYINRDVTDTPIGRGIYYVAMSLSNTTGTVLRSVASNFATYHRAFGVLQEESAVPLPSTATPVALSTNYIPVIGASLRATF